MSDLLNAEWRSKSEVVYTPVGDEAVLLHTGSNTYFGLDEIGSYIFQRLADQQTPRLIAEEIVSAFDVKLERVTSDILHLLEKFSANGLLTQMDSKRQNR